MSISVLDPTKLSLNILGCRVEGFSKGSFVTIGKEAPTFSTRTSVKGTKLVVGNKTADYSLSFRLDNTANANTWLHSVYKLQEMYGVVFPVPVIYKDNNGSTSFFCATGVMEEPRVDQGDGVNPTEWRIICPRAVNTIGGSGKDEAIAKILQTIATVLSVYNFAGVNVGGILEQAQGIRDKVSSVVGGFF